MTRERRNGYGFPTGSTIEPLFWFWTGVMVGVVLLVTGVVRK